MSKWNQEDIDLLIKLRHEDLTWEQLTEVFVGQSANSLRKAYYRYNGQDTKPIKTGPKVLVIDLETLPLEVYAWGLFDQNIGLEMVKTDWSILSFSAKWLGSPESEVMYYDTRNEKDIRNDKKLCEIVHSLLDEADVTLTQNGVRFDLPKLNARFIKHGLKPPSSYRNIDTLRIAKKVFGFTSNKLAYMTDLLCEKYKKLDHSEFSGFKLWSECMKGNLKAFESMEKYNKYDVLSLEELYTKLAPWDKTVRFSSYSEETEDRCSCGSTEFKQKGYIYNNASKYERFICQNCGKEHRGAKNVITKENKMKKR